MCTKKLLLVLLTMAMLLSGVLVMCACHEDATWPDYPLELTCEFVWNPPQGDNEVAIRLTATNNQERVVTQFSVYLFSQTSYDYIDNNPPVDSKRITIYDLNLAKGESYTTDVSFNLIFDGRGMAKSAKGSLYGTWVEFDNGLSQWGDPELRERDDISQYGFKITIR